LKIIRREIQRSGRDIHVAWIDTEGVDLGVDTILPREELEDIGLSSEEKARRRDEERALEQQAQEPRFRAVRAIDARTVEDVEDDDDGSVELLPEDLEPVLADGIIDLDKIYFCIDTYKKLATDPHEMWDKLLRPANGFLSSLSLEDSKLLCLFFIDVRKIIDEELIVLRGNLADVATVIGNKLYDLSMQIDLPAKLIYYCKNCDIPVPDLSYAGTRVGQDREEMTFKEEEYYRLMAISILCKILCPIWGDLTFRTIKDIDTMQKETHCIGVIMPILSTELFAQVDSKLYNYISSIVDTAMSQSYVNASFTATIGGFSRDRFHKSVYAMILVKRYVNVDLYKPNGNLMVWTSTCVKQSFNSLLGTLNKKCHVMKRVDISDGPDRGDEESNVSVLEHSSRVTTVTADVPSLIQFGVHAAIKNICSEYQISDLDFQLAMTYYIQNPIQVTLLNKILVGILVGNRIGGARGLKYLSHLDYTQLVVITQLYIANNFPSALVHLLTAVTPEEPKTTSNNVDVRINMVFKETVEFRECEKAFPTPIDNIGIQNILFRIKDHVTKFNHLANTAPNVSTTMDESPLQKGSVIEYDEMVMRHFSGLILQIISKEKHLTTGV
jgi:hypothetical protein